MVNEKEELKKIIDTVDFILTHEDYDTREKLIYDFVKTLNSKDYELDFKHLIREAIDENERDIHFFNERAIKNGQSKLYHGMLEVRICSHCNNVMAKGYCIEGGEDYYCSDECLEKNMTREEFNELYDDGEGNSYWTNWY